MGPTSSAANKSDIRIVQRESGRVAAQYRVGATIALANLLQALAYTDRTRKVPINKLGDRNRELPRLGSRLLPFPARLARPEWKAPRTGLQPLSREAIQM